MTISAPKRLKRRRSLKALLLTDVARGSLDVPSRRRTGPYAIEARYDQRQRRIAVVLNTGIVISFAPDMVEGLKDARPRDLRSIEICHSGQGLHFSALDADVYVSGLLAGTFGSGRWMAAHKREAVR